MDVWCEGCGEYMRKVESGVIVEVGNRMVRHGDRYRCGNCDKTVLSDFGEAYEK